jgi:hypothetical protein
VRTNRKTAVKFDVYSSNCAAVGYMDGTCIILRTRVNINLLTFLIICGCHIWNLALGDTALV